MRNDRGEKKCPNHPHQLQAQWALAILLSKLVGRPGTRSLPSTIAPPDHRADTETALIWDCYDPKTTKTHLKFDSEINISFMQI